jgi:hypothetical protein
MVDFVSFSLCRALLLSCLFSFGKVGEISPKLVSIPKFARKEGSPSESCQIADFES